MTQPAFHGIVPPMITPLDDQQGVDLDGLGRLADRMIAGGVHGLFALGTTGEGPSLPMSHKQQVVATVCDQVAGRVPVLVGITDTIYEASLEVAEMAYAAGAAAVVLAPPYYLPMTQLELTDYSLRLADAIRLPVMLYNMPGCCKTWYEADTVYRLGQHPRIVGLKDSSGDLEYFRTVVDLFRDQPEFAFFVGPEEILVSAMRIGCHGGVHGGANMFPHLYTAMYQAAADSNWSLADEHQRLVLEVGSKLYGVGDGPSRIIKGIKSVCQLLDVCASNQLAEPFAAHTSAERSEIQHRLSTILGRLEESAIEV